MQTDFTHSRPYSDPDLTFYPPCAKHLGQEGIYHDKHPNMAELQAIMADFKQIHMIDSALSAHAFYDPTRRANMFLPPYVSMAIWTAQHWEETPEQIVTAEDALVKLAS